MKFAKRMERMQASEIRELLKLTAQPDIISFAGGLPAPELFPVEEIAKVSHDLVEKEGRALLQYATTEGRPTLRAKIAKRMKDKYHTEVNPDDILITTGSQQCLDFAGKLFLDPGDVVLCESPSYLGALNAFNAYEPNFVEVPTDDGGLIPEELDKILETTPNCKFIYVIPDFQRPYCWTMDDIQKILDDVDDLRFLQETSYRNDEYYFGSICLRRQENSLNLQLLDGQQRLTSLYLALFGRYDIHKYRAKWENDDRRFKMCHLYCNLTQSKKPQDNDIKYEFLWRDKNDTQEQTIHQDKDSQKWFKCGDFYKYETSRVRKIAKEFNLTEAEEENLDKLHQKIFDTRLINFYLEEEQNPDKAVNIFIRTNAGGEPLEYADILFSIVVANWTKVDVRTEINDLLDTINKGLDFDIDKDLILKGFLFLFHNSVKFQINSFEKAFVESLEAKWEGIKNAFIETFKLLQSFGLNAQRLSSNNAILPILYFIYHKGLTEDIVEKIGQKDNREIIKKWLLRVIILKPFGGSGDAVLTRMRQAFIKDFKQENEKYFDSTMDTFPLDSIEKEAKYKSNLDDEFLSDMIWDSRKNS